MKNVEVTFHCHKCGKAVEFDKQKLECEHCGHHLVWSHVSRTYEDKYLEMYEVLI